jgi:hypothetical protein
MSNKSHSRKRNKAADYIQWDIVCEPAILEKLKTQERFWQVIALARSVNALSFAHWAMLPVMKDDSLHAQRTRTNSFFFACGILYEALLLVEKMNKNFHTEDTFAGLKAILKDTTARKIRSFHLGRARNNMVFHYLPESFGEIVNIPGFSECSFVAGSGKQRMQSYYTFADVLAMEFFVGFAANNSEKFYEVLGELMLSTRQLAANFVDAAEHLISRNLLKWGFKMREQTSTAPSTKRAKRKGPGRVTPS